MNPKIAVLIGKAKPDEKKEDDGYECPPELKLAMYEFLGAAGFGSPDPERCEKACKAFQALFLICESQPHDEG